MRPKINPSTVSWADRSSRVAFSTPGPIGKRSRSSTPSINTFALIVPFVESVKAWPDGRSPSLIVAAYVPLEVTRTSHAPMESVFVSALKPFGPSIETPTPWIGFSVESVIIP